MSRRTLHLLVLCGIVALAVLAPATTASAAGPTSITIDGPGLAQPLAVTAKSQPDAFKRLLSEVAWLATRSSGNAPTPDPARLGPKFTALVSVNDKPDQVYELYPQAAGGPRVFRPANQPNKRKTAAAWFYGRLSLEDSLREAGVPLTSNGVRVISGGGRGGGEAVVPGVPASSSPKGQSLGQVVEQLRLSVLLSGGVALVLMLALAGMARIARR